MGGVNDRQPATPHLALAAVDGVRAVPIAQDGGMGFLILLLLVGVAWSIWNAVLVRRRGRGPVRWFLISLLIAHGVTIAQMVELVRAGLASAHAERVVAGRKTMEVATVRSRQRGGGRWQQRSDDDDHHMHGLPR